MNAQGRPWHLRDPRDSRPPYWLRLRDPQTEREHRRLMDEQRLMTATRKAT